jgi:organic radical activating enzyme
MLLKQYRLPEQEKNAGVYSSTETMARLHWDINTICDFHCAYCYARQQLEWNKIMNKDSINKVLNQLRTIGKSTEVVLLGGEPSLSPHYFYILDELEKIPHIVATASISNGQGKVGEEWIANHAKYKNFFFNFSFHPSETTIDILKKHILMAKDCRLLVHILLAGPKFDDITKDVINFCKLHNVTIKANVPFSPINTQVYMTRSKSYKEWIRSYKDYFENYLYFVTEDGTRVLNDIDVYLEDLNRFKGWMCKNKNFFVDGKLEISQFCSGPNDGQEYMTCVLERCTCQGLLSDEKINTTINPN